MMRFIVKWLVVSLIVLSGVVGAHAGQRHHSPSKHRATGLSFSIHVGGPIMRHVSHLPHRQQVVRGCSPRQVSAIARNYGIQYQTIYRNSRTMTVVGYKNGYFARICISRAPDCRIIR
jgi:hypothetical protein